MVGQEEGKQTEECRSTNPSWTVTGLIADYIRTKDIDSSTS